MIRRFSFALFLTFALTFCAASGQMPGTDLAVKSPSGLRALGAKDAVVWSITGSHFNLWRLDAAGTGVVTTALPLPAELTRHLKSQTPDDTEDDYGFVNVEAQGGEIRLLWFEDVPQSDAEFEKRGDFPALIVQASSTDLGVTWRVDRTPFRSWAGLEMVYDYAVVDAQHAWLLGAGEPGAGQLPEELFRTADGGRTWKEADGDEAHGAPPIGRNGGQLLAAKDATHAWFIATCAGCEDDAFLAAAYTDDGGRRWNSAKLVQHYPECANCYPSAISRASSTAGDCFDVNLTPMDENDHRTSIPVHFCSYDGGHTWEKPLRGMTVSPKGGFTFHEGWCDWVVYAQGDPELGMTGDFVHTPADAQHKTDWSEERLIETRDGGHTWLPILPELKEGITPVRSLQAKGDLVWLMLSDGPGGRILLSRDHGVTWSSIVGR